MRTKWILSLLCLCSCDLLGPGVGIGTPRFEEQHRYGNGDGEEVIPGTVNDTVIYLSAISAPQDYDWRRDSLFGAACCTLKFYSGNISDDVITALDAILELPTGRSTKVSADADRHHIIDGHIYTEYSDASGTYVGEDGRLILSFPEREFIIGMLPDADLMWTLGRNAAGGFSLRRDGQVLFKSNAGMVFGGFAHPGYGENGALYMDEGKVCFSYSVYSGGRTSAFLVRDGEESQVLTTGVGTVLDVKSIGGRAVAICSYPDGTVLQHDGDSVDFGMGAAIYWIAGGLVDAGGRTMIAGTFSYDNSPGQYGGLGTAINYFDLGEGTTAVAWSDEAAFGAGQMDDGTVFYLGRGFNGLEFCSDFSKERCYLFSQDCVKLLGRHYYLALTPMDGGYPYIMSPSERKELRINGFLTGVSICVGPDG